MICSWSCGLGAGKLEPLAKALTRSVMLERVALAPSAALDHGDSFAIADAQGGKTTQGPSLVHG